MTTIRLRAAALVVLLALISSACSGSDPVEEADGVAADAGSEGASADGENDGGGTDVADADATENVDADGTEAADAGTGTGECVPSDSNDPIRVGTILSVTGPIANVGDKMRRGIELAIAQINAEGGIEGRTIEQVFYDAAGDTATAVEQTRRLLEQDEVDVIVGGGSSSGVALAMLPITQEAGVLFMATEGARQIVEPAEEHALTFKATFNDTVVLERTIEFWQEQGVESVAFLPDTGGFGQSAQEVIEELAESAGIALSVESFDPAATDLTPQLSSLSSGTPGAYMAWTTTPAGVVFMNNANQLGLNDEAFIQHGFGFIDERFFEQAGDAGDGVILTSGPLPIYDQLPADDPQKPVIADFVEAYDEMFNEFPNVFAGQTYDGMQLVAEAICRAGSTDGEALATALEGVTDYVAISGVYNMSSDDHSGLSADDAHIIEWDGERFSLFEQ
jgi:branched-chain amino acid transport system substrate-binding protein